MEIGREMAWERRKSNGRILSTLRREAGLWALIVPFLALMLFVIWVPTLKGMVWSFFRMDGYQVGEFIGLDNYKIVLKDTEFVGTLFNTLKYVLWSIVIGFWPPIVIAVLLNEMRVGKGYFKFSVYFPSMVPAIAVSMLWYYMYYPNGSGLLNMLRVSMGFEPSMWLQNARITIPLIITTMTWNGLGGSVLIYLAALQGINGELYEAAVVDGVGFIRRFWNIALPQISGVILINLVRQVVGIFQIMEQPLAMTAGGPNNASMSLGLLGYRYAFQTFKIGNSLALNVIMFLILMVLTIFYFILKDKFEADA